ncbi:MAG TPA: PepSY domain-containing protein [Bacillus sp. (in: firmicutes)]
MKRKVLIGTVVSALVLGGAFVVGASNNDDSNSSKSTTSDSLNSISKSENEKISIEEAETIALKEVKGIVDSVELKQKSDKVFYKVEVENDDLEYDVYIDAITGKVTSVNQDDQYDDDKNDDKYDDNSDDDLVGDDDDSSSVKANNTQINNTISQAQAIKIAEEAVNGKMTEIDKDQDDGLLQFEVELRTDRGKAEVDVDASTGKVLKVEFDD